MHVLTNSLMPFLREKMLSQYYWHGMRSQESLHYTTFNISSWSGWDTSSKDVELQIGSVHKH